MNDDKDRILQACNSFSAEELFHFIRSGELTLLDLVRAGLDDNKLVGLQELMAIEEDDLWAEVQSKRTPELCRRYLQAYPNGRYAGRCTKLMLQLADGTGNERPTSAPTADDDQQAPPSAPAGSPKPAPTTEEEKLWHEVQTQRTMQLCGRYLQTYPDGRHAGECVQIISRLTEKQNEQRKHTAATPPAGNNRPAASPSPAKQRKHNQKPPRKLLWGSTILALLLAVLVWQLTTADEKEELSDEPREERTETQDKCSEATDPDAPITDETNDLLYDEVKQNLLYFHDKQTWDDNMFDATRRNLETLYYQKDKDNTARELLSLVEKDVVTPYYGDACSKDLRFIIEMEVNAESFDNFIDRLESQIKKWDKERQKKEAEPAFHLNQPTPAPQQKEEKAKGTKPSKPKARTTTPKSDTKAKETDATTDAPGGTDATTDAPGGRRHS